MQGACATAHVHAQRFPREWLLENPLAQVAGKEQSIGSLCSKRSKKAQLSAVESAGTRCTSSRIARCGSPATKPAGSCCAALRAASLSKEK
jgi:hypothetical protein